MIINTNQIAEYLVSIGIERDEAQDISHWPRSDHYILVLDRAKQDIWQTIDGLHQPLPLLATWTIGPRRQWVLATDACLWALAQRPSAYDPLIVELPDDLVDWTMANFGNLRPDVVAWLAQRDIDYEHEANEWYTASSNRPIEPLGFDGGSNFDHFLAFKAAEHANLFELAWCCDAEDRHEIVSQTAPRITPQALLDALRERNHTRKQPTTPEMGS